MSALQESLANVNKEKYTIYATLFLAEFSYTYQSPLSLFLIFLSHLQFSLLFFLLPWIAFPRDFACHLSSLDWVKINKSNVFLSCFFFNAFFFLFQAFVKLCSAFRLSFLLARSNRDLFVEIRRMILWFRFRLMHTFYILLVNIR